MWAKIAPCSTACLSSVSFQQAALSVSAFIQMGWVFLFISTKFLSTSALWILVHDKPNADY